MAFSPFVFIDFWVLLRQWTQIEQMMAMKNVSSKSHFKLDVIKKLWYCYQFRAVMHVLGLTGCKLDAQKSWIDWLSDVKMHAKYGTSCRSHIDITGAYISFTTGFNLYYVCRPLRNKHNPTDPIPKWVWRYRKEITKFLEILNNQRYWPPVSSQIHNIRNAKKEGNLSEYNQMTLHMLFYGNHPLPC